VAAPDLNAIATAAAATITAASVTLYGRALKVYDHEPREVDTLPAAWVRGPIEFARAPVDEPERELGREDWDLTYEVMVMVQMDAPETGQDDANTVLQVLLYAFDADPSLGGLPGVTEARLSEGDRTYVDTDDANRQAVLWTCRLDVMAQSTQ
jgi:hypothetical protein